jgi:predicted nuclease of predicted toxin-antitoxin system
VRLLLDANLSPRAAELLTAKGFDAVHVRQRGMQHAMDGQILTPTADEERILVSEDSDFGALLARSQAALPPLCCCAPAIHSRPMITPACSKKDSLKSRRNLPPRRSS